MKEKSGLRPYGLLLLLTVLIIAPFASLGQLKGSYISKALDKSASLIINGKTFEITVFGDITSKKGAGAFKIKKDSIYFSYQPLVNKDSSIYTVKANKGEGTSLSHIHVAFEDGRPVKTTRILIKDKNNGVLKTLTVDNSGQLDIDLGGYAKTDQLEIAFIGYEIIYIPIIKLIGFTTEISAILKPQLNYYIPPHIDSYQVVRFDADSIVLKKASETITYEAVR
jgi:hypothetical protein